MKRFRNAPQADADLDSITDYYAPNNPDAGIRVLDEIAARCRQLASQPRQGRERSDLGADIRSHGSRDVTPDMFDESAPP
jgi:plasmid stabilization system protein ParE